MAQVDEEIGRFREANGDPFATLQEQSEGKSSRHPGAQALA